MLTGCWLPFIGGFVFFFANSLLAHTRRQPAACQRIWKTMSFLPTTERVWTLAEIASARKVDLSTVRRWTRRRSNRLRVLKFGHRTVRVRDSALAAFFKAHEV